MTFERSMKNFLNKFFFKCCRNWWRRTAFLGALAGAIGGAGRALAAESAGGGAGAGAGGVSPAASKTLSFFSLSGEASWQTPAEIYGGDGRFSKLSSEASLSYFYKGEENTFFVGASYRYNDYRFDCAGGAAGGAFARGTVPYSVIHDTAHVSLLGFYERKIINKKFGAFSLLGTLGGSLSAATNADLVDGHTGFVGCAFKYSNQKLGLSVQYGFLVASKIMDGPTWAPYSGIEWKINKHWTLKTSSGLAVSYDVYGDNRFLLDAYAAYRVSDYLLAPVDDAGISRFRRERDFQSKEVLASVGVTREFLNRALCLRAVAGGIFYAHYKLRSHGRNMGEFDTAPSAFFRFEITGRF
jgi:hypothetical protein